MTPSAIQTLITDTLSAVGNAVFVILTAVVGIAIAYFLFKWAYRKITYGVFFDVMGTSYHSRWKRNRANKFIFRSGL